MTVFPFQSRHGTRQKYPFGTFNQILHHQLQAGSFNTIIFGRNHFHILQFFLFHFVSTSLCQHIPSMVIINIEALTHLSRFGFVRSTLGQGNDDVCIQI